MQEKKEPTDDTSKDVYSLLFTTLDYATTATNIQTTRYYT